MRSCGFDLLDCRDDKKFVVSRRGLGALLSGKLIGLLNLLITLVAIFGNGVVGYLKLIGGNERSREVYTSLLGTGFFEVVICVGLILAFFLKPKRESIKAPTDG